MMLLNLVYCLLVTAPHSGFRPCGGLPGSSSRLPTAAFGLVGLYQVLAPTGLLKVYVSSSRPHTALLRRLCGVTGLLLTAPHYAPSSLVRGYRAPPHGSTLRSFVACAGLLGSSSRLHTTLLRRLCGVTGILSLRDCLRYNSPFSILHSQFFTRTIIAIGTRPLIWSPSPATP